MTKINQARKARMEKLSNDQLKKIAAGGTLSWAAADYELTKRLKKAQG